METELSFVRLTVGVIILFIPNGEQQNYLLNDFYHRITETVSFLKHKRFNIPTNFCAFKIYFNV